MNPTQTDRAWIEVDSAALLHNLAALRARLPSGCALMPVLKAEAYGHGAVWAARLLEDAGVRAFCVATAREGAALREAGIRGEILILGATAPSLFPLLRQYELTQTVTDLPYARRLAQAGPVRAQMKIDTGMHRLGLPWDGVEELAQVLQLEGLQVTGLFTHLCCDETRSPRDRAFTEEQGRRFYGAVRALRDRGFTAPAVHLLASHGLLNYPELGGDYARVGIALYGAAGGAGRLGLRPVLSLKARLAQVRQVRRGQGVGYDLAFTAARDSRIAVVTVGYADGVPRNLSEGGGAVLVRGCRAPMVGRICMDQLLVDVTEVPGAAAGGEAVLIGASGGWTITACEVAEQAGTIPNEILSRLGARLGRIER